MCIRDSCESGSTLRFLIPVACALGVDTKFIGRGRLPQRPITPYLEAVSYTHLDVYKRQAQSCQFDVMFLTGDGWWLGSPNGTLSVVDCKKDIKITK